MKRYIILLLIVFAGVNAMAQGMEQETLADGTPIKMLGSMVYKNNRKLDKKSAAECFSMLNGVDRSEDYLKYRAGYKTGLGLTIGGASLAIVGFGVSFVGVLVALPHAFAGNETPGADFAIYSGVGAMIAGGACFVAGIPTLCVYKTRLNRLKKDYNMQLQVGASQNGLSMSLCF